MSDLTGIERLKRNETRIITQQPRDGIFIIASFRVWNVRDPAVPFQIQGIALDATRFAAARVVGGDITWVVNGVNNNGGQLIAVSVAATVPKIVGRVTITN